MTRVGVLAAPFRFALRRMRQRPLAVGLITLALAGAGAMIGWSSLTAALAQEENVEVRLRELAPDQRSVQLVYHLPPSARDSHQARVESLFDEFSGQLGPPHRFTVLHSIGPGVRLFVPDNPVRDVRVHTGRLPRGCAGSRCEVLALTDDFRIGERVEFEDGVFARVVGIGSLPRTAFPSEEEAIDASIQVGRSALLARTLQTPLEELVGGTGSSVVAMAVLDPNAVHASDLRSLNARLRRELVRIEREVPVSRAGGPLVLLDDIADRGDIARERLLLVAGQGAALVLAFAAFAATARRRETLVLDDQLRTLGASRVQIGVARATETVAPSALGAVLALGGVWLSAELLERRRGLAPSFSELALPAETALAIAVVTAFGAGLLLASLAPARRSRFGIGALEVSAVAALVVVVWQVAATGALDPDRIAAGGGTSPVLLIVPALAFFATAVLLLRILPLALRGGERAARGAPFGVRLAFLTGARNPAQAAAATSFLAVALGSALFGLNYQRTLERQAHDEARFTAGASWRVVERSASEESESSDVTPLTRFARVTDERPTPVLRLSAQLRESVDSGEPPSVEILAVPAERLPSVLGWRNSFSRASRQEIARRIRPRPVRLDGIELAPTARALRIWVRGQNNRPRIAVLHFLRQDDQRFAHVRLGVVPDGRWRRLRVAVPPWLRGADLIGVEFEPAFVLLNGQDPGGLLELGRFEEQRSGRWVALPPLDAWTGATLGRSAEQGTLLATQFPRGAPVDRGVQVEILPSSLLPLIRPALELPEALPALASGRVARAAVDGLVIVDVLGAQLPIRVAARAQLFPTVVEQPELFAVLDYDTLFAWLNADQPGLVLPSEAWFFQAQAPGFGERLAERPFRLERAIGVENLTARLLSDPLAAGTRDVLGIAAIAAAALGVFGLALMTRSTLSSERLLFAEYEALGVPPGTLVRSTQVRLLALSIVGVAAGFLGGLLAARLIGAFVAVTGTAGEPLPPIEPVLAWGAGLVVLGVVAAAGLATAALLARREFREVAARRLRA